MPKFETKTFEILLNLSSQKLYSLDIRDGLKGSTILLQILNDQYRNKCYNGVYIENVREIISVLDPISDCNITMDIYNLYITILAEVSIYDPGDLMICMFSSNILGTNVACTSPDKKLFVSFNALRKISGLIDQMTPSNFFVVRLADNIIYMNNQVLATGTLFAYEQKYVMYKVRDHVGKNNPDIVQQLQIRLNETIAARDKYLSIPETYRDFVNGVFYPYKKVEGVSPQHTRIEGVSPQHARIEGVSPQHTRIEGVSPQHTRIETQTTENIIDIAQNKNPGGYAKKYFYVPSRIPMQTGDVIVRSDLTPDVIADIKHVEKLDLNFIIYKLLTGYYRYINVVNQMHELCDSVETLKKNQLVWDIYRDKI